MTHSVIRFQEGAYSLTFSSLFHLSLISLIGCNTLRRGVRHLQVVHNCPRPPGHGMGAE